MIYTIGAYFDKETEKFNPCMLFPFDKAAMVETISEGVRKGKIEGAEAFDLYYLGSYDTADASFKLVKPEMVLVCVDYVRKE